MEHGKVLGASVSPGEQEILCWKSGWLAYKAKPPPPPPPPEKDVFLEQQLPRLLNCNLLAREATIVAMHKGQTFCVGAQGSSFQLHFLHLS